MEGEGPLFSSPFLSLAGAGGGFFGIAARGHYFLRGDSIAKREPGSVCLLHSPFILVASDEGTNVSPGTEKEEVGTGRALKDPGKVSFACFGFQGQDQFHIKAQVG